jgi:hypothetical protein
MSSQSTLFHVLNYLTRGVIVVIGLLLLLGWLLPPKADAGMMRTFGIVFILFGLYRIVSYYSAQKRLQRENEREEE